MLPVQTLIWSSFLLGTALAIDYQCLPFPVASVCMIDYVYYKPGGDPITFPTGYQHYRIMMPRSSKQDKSNVITFDEALYQAMHRPSHVEITYTEMKSMALPPELLLGNFGDNRITSVTVATGRNYQISYLDLKSNELTDIEFVHHLVNLEMLHLESNSISTIPASALIPLTKLKYLYLQYNYFTSIPWSDLPRSLIHLDCYYDRLSSVVFTNITLPSMEYLALSHNDLSTINVTDLLRATPRLKETHLFNLKIPEHEMALIRATVVQHNITYGESTTFLNYCSFDDGYKYVNGKCVQQTPIEKPILLTMVVIGVAALFVYIVMLTFRFMNR